METVLEWLLRELGETARKLDMGIDSAVAVVEECEFGDEFDYNMAFDSVAGLGDFPQDLHGLVREARQRLKEGRVAA
jgi:hypothetical protein